MGAPGLNNILTSFCVFLSPSLSLSLSLSLPFLTSPACLFCLFLSFSFNTAPPLDCLFHFILMVNPSEIFKTTKTPKIFEVGFGG